MPQLPSVSELMVGAHLPRFADRPDQTLLAHHWKRSETTPRHLESYITLPQHKQPVSPSQAPPASHGAPGHLPSHGGSHHHVGRLTPPASAQRVVSSVSPHGTVVVLSQPPPSSANGAHGATAGAFYPPSAAAVHHGQGPGDYFSYRNGTGTGNGSANNNVPPPLLYGMYKRTGLVLLLLESMLRITLVAGVVQRVELSPALQLAAASYNMSDRLSLFLQESTRALHTAGPLAAYPAPMGQIIYAQSYAPYAQLPPQPALANGSTSASSMGPVAYGIPPLGKSVLQPYGGVHIPSHYGQVMVGPSQVVSAVPEPPSQQATEQNYALINKRRIIKRRTRTGCLTCRKRRIKCDERKPHCFNCERLKKLCLGYEVLPSSTKRRDLEGDSKPSAHRSSVHDLL